MKYLTNQLVMAIKGHWAGNNFDFTRYTKQFTIYMILESTGKQEPLRDMCVDTGLYAEQYQSFKVNFSQCDVTGMTTLTPRGRRSLMG